LGPARLRLILTSHVYQTVRLSGVVKGDEAVYLDPLPGQGTVLSLFNFHACFSTAQMVEKIGWIGLD